MNASTSLKIFINQILFLCFSFIWIFRVYDYSFGLPRPLCLLLKTTILNELSNVAGFHMKILYKMSYSDSKIYIDFIKHRKTFLLLLLF